MAHQMTPDTFSVYSFQIFLIKSVQLWLLELNSNNVALSTVSLQSDSGKLGCEFSPVGAQLIILIHCVSAIFMEYVQKIVSTIWEPSLNHVP